MVVTSANWRKPILEMFVTEADTDVTDLVREFFARTPGVSDQARADLLGVGSRSLMGSWKSALKENQRIRSRQYGIKRGLISFLQRVEVGGGVEYLAGYAAALEEMSAKLEQMRESLAAAAARDHAKLIRDSGDLAERAEKGTLAERAGPDPQVGGAPGA